MALIPKPYLPQYMHGTIQNTDKTYYIHHMKRSIIGLLIRSNNTNDNSSETDSRNIDNRNSNNKVRKNYNSIDTISNSNKRILMIANSNFRSKIRTKPIPRGWPQSLYSTSQYSISPALLQIFGLRASWESLRFRVGLRVY